MGQIKKIVQFYGIDTFFEYSSTLPSPSLSQREVDLENLRRSYSFQNETSEEHLSVIKELVEDEASRLSSIESKISQVVTQSGLVFVLTSFVAPIFNDNLNDLPLYLKLVAVVSFILSFVAYLVSILVASQIFGIHKFIYIRTSPASVIDSPQTKEEFIAKRIKDLIYQVGANRNVINRKADLLIYANRWFVSGFFLSGVLSLCICSSLLFIENKENKIEELLLGNLMLQSSINESNADVKKLREIVIQSLDSAEASKSLKVIVEIQKRIDSINVNNKTILRKIEESK